MYLMHFYFRNLLSEHVYKNERARRGDCESKSASGTAMLVLDPVLRSLSILFLSSHGLSGESQDPAAMPSCLSEIAWSASKV